MLHKETVSAQLVSTLKTLMELEDLRNYRLVGGTALALQLGHRESVDIDLFTDFGYDEEIVTRALEEKFPQANNYNYRTYGVTFTISDIKVDIYEWREHFIRPVVVIETIRMAHIEDIAAMKLDTLRNRATKRDYYDIAELLAHYSLKELLNFYQEKFPQNSIRNVIDVINLIPIGNAELESSPDPRTFTDISWSSVKKKIAACFEKFLHDELQAKREEMNKRK